ncbi:MAG: nitrogenase [Deltaproteobacteria bacterium]|nr:MAG: nitrogenase [Deltaproteobacteria bacterium]
MGEPAKYVSSTNACRQCTPLGACLAFKGVRGAVPYLHGSQGCATYMRRYIISHFREPIDIASSALGEKQAVFGGGPNLKEGLVNVIGKYSPEVIGIATTCLTETIGDDVASILIEFDREWGAAKKGEHPQLVRVSTPSYQGSHVEGFHATVRALADQLALSSEGVNEKSVNLFPGIVSTADLRALREIVEGFGLTATILPDYSDTLDGPALDRYMPISPGGTGIEEIKLMGGAVASVEFASLLPRKLSAGELLKERFWQRLDTLGLPLGLRATDAFFSALSSISGESIPERYKSQRGRLLDAFVDGHKYLSGKRAVIYGDEELALGLTSFIAEVGIQPVVVATGSSNSDFEDAVKGVTEGLVLEEVKVVDGVDFSEIEALAAEAKPDLLIGNSKGYRISRELGVPLIRVGFPIHDRFGGQRTLHLGYEGALSLFDNLVNAVITKKQEDSPIGYAYI